MRLRRVGSWSLRERYIRVPNGSTELAEVLVDRAMGLLADWYHEMASASDYDVDPMMTVLREGGPFHTRGRLPAYLERLRATGRAHHAKRLAARHPDEV